MWLEAKTNHLKQCTQPFDQQGWESPRAFDGKPETGWAIYPQVGKPQSADFELAKPLELPVGTMVGLTMLQNYGSGATLGKFRLAVTSAASAVPLPEAISQILAKPAGQTIQAGEPET